MDKEELDLLEIVFTLAIGECAYNDINNIQKLEDKIKTINNLCTKQKEVIDKINLIIKGIAYGGNKDYYMENFSKINELLKEVK